MSDDTLKKMTRDMAERGLLIEAGWMVYRASMLEPDAPDDEVFAAKVAFFSGAHHLFSSIMACLDPGTEETPGDMRRLDQINVELETFVKDMLGIPDRAAKT